jgi:sodium-coupled neutral amino acid transporter 11
LAACINSHALLLVPVKSLRLLIDTAKHVDVSTYERLAEASFGRFGFNFITFSMFVMSYGAMVGYMIIIKTNLSYLLGVETNNVEMSRAVLTVSSLAIILPLSMQRDMSNLSKTSAISVIFDIILVGIVSVFSPVTESVREHGGWKELLQDSSPDIRTFFTGVGVLCFAFVCQHSAFIIAASLDRPTKARWNLVTSVALSTCCVLACIIGVAGYIGFMTDTDGDILVNLGELASAPGASVTFKRASNIARGLLCTTMFFVYPMELFVARHVCVVMFFKGRRAREGDLHSVLARKDRRISVTLFLYIISLVPALLFDDLGSVFSVTGSLGGAALSYIAPGICYIAVHGTEFLELASQRWSYVPTKLSSDSNFSIKSTPTSMSTTMSPTSRRALHPDDIEKGTNSNLDSVERPRKNICARCFDCFLWYILLMPIWCKVALFGKKMMTKHREEEALKSPMPYAFGKIIHNNKPQFGHLMRPMGMGRMQTDDDSDSEERKPLIRTLSNPQMGNTSGNVRSFAPLSNSIKLPPLPPARKAKAKVGFSLAPGHSAANEKVALDRSNPINHDSFSPASFEMARESIAPSYGATQSKTLQDEVKLIRQASNTMSEVEDDSAAHRSSLANSFNDDELTYDDEDAIGSEGSSVYISDDDSQSNKSSASEEIRSINFLKQQQTLQPTVKLVDKTPNLDAVKVNPLVKKRLNERRNAVSVQNDEGKSDEEDDPQDDMPSVFDFVTAVFYILFGVIAATAGLYSSLLV